MVWDGEAGKEEEREMNLINELRMLAEDLYVNGYNRYSAAMSKAADELDKWEVVFGHLGGTPDECGNAIIAARDELEAAEKERDWNAERLVDAIEECTALRAKIEEMEKQEPVAFALCSGWARKAVYLSEIEACEQRDRRQLTADLGGSLEAYRVVPLYLAPGAQPAPSVPVDLITDYLVIISAHVAHQDDTKAQAEIGELLRMLAAAPEAKPCP